MSFSKALNNHEGPKTISLEFLTLKEMIPSLIMLIVGGTLQAVTQDIFSGSPGPGVGKYQQHSHHGGVQWSTINVPMSNVVLYHLKSTSILSIIIYLFIVLNYRHPTNNPLVIK